MPHHSLTIFSGKPGELFAQLPDFGFAQIDPIALLEDVEKKDRHLAAPVIRHYAVATALAATGRREPDLASAARADDQLARPRICRDVVDDGSPRDLTDPGSPRVAQIVGRLDDRLYCRDGGNATLARQAERWQCHPCSHSIVPGGLLVMS